MSITLTYPIRETHENLALKKDQTVVAYYRIPNTPITITDDEKKGKHKITVAQMMKKLQKNKFFEISLIPKDYLLEEKMRDFSDALADDSRELGEELLLYTVDRLTDEMEIPYQFDWVVGVTLRKQNHGATVKDLAYESFNEFTEKIAKGLGYEYELSPTWYEDYKSDEFTIFQAFSVLRAKRLSNEELFYYQRMQYLRYIPHYKKEVLANRAQFNITDTLIKVLKGGFLKLESPYGSSFVTILPVGKFPVQFNGFHLGEFIQRLNFPVELRIKAEFIDTGKIKGRMGRSNTRYRNIMEEAENTDTVQQDEIIMGSISLKDLMKKVGNKEDIIEYGAYLIVSASSVNQLRQRRQVVLNYFDDKDVFIFNDTKVFPARLYGNKEKTGARIEVFLLRELNEELRLWDVLVDPARKIRIGNKLYFGADDSMVAEVIDNTTSRGRTLRFLYDGPHDEFKKALYALGETPLPHSIINRPVEPEDSERFQSIFAKNEGAVTAPTASLHFSRELMKRLEIKGIDFAYITLHAGLGNFRDIDVEDLTKHKMDSEQMKIGRASCRERV